MLSRSECWILNKIMKKVVAQGDHEKKIVAFYSLFIIAAREEFSEDNKATLDSFLEECHSESLETTT